ncbi:MAG TPA: tetratricopeptide repeat protein, partial [bacterium]
PRNAEYLGLLIRYETRFGLFGEAFETALLIEEGNREKQRGDALFRFAQGAFQAGGLEPAQKAYEFFLKRFPSFRQLDMVLFNLSRCYAGSERYRESVGVLDELIRRFPQSRLAANALLEKGLLERDPLRRPDQAASTFQKLLDEYSLSRECDRVRFELIDCYILQNDLHQARIHCQQTVRLASSMDRSIRVKADFYLSELDFFMGDFIRASSRLDSLFRTHFGVEETQDPVLNDALSLSMLSKILAKADSEGRSIFAGGMLAMRQKRIDQAVKAFDRIVKTPAAYPSLVAEALYQNGLALLAVSRYPDGIVCFKRLLEDYPGHIHAERALERLGYAQEKSGEIQNALKTYEAFIETFPRSVLSDEVRKRIRKMDEGSS